MKRLVSISLICAMLFSISLPAYALTTDTPDKHDVKVVPSFNTDNVYSTENPMPTISNMDLKQAPDLSTNSRFLPSRRNWIAETTVYLESLYEQAVCNVQETPDYIVFWFDSDAELNDYSSFPLFDKASVNTIEKETEGVQGYVLKVEYLKPESSLTKSSLETKIVYMWGWSNGLIRLDASPSAGTVFNVSSSVMLMALAFQLTPLQSIVLTAFQMTASEFISAYGASRPVRGETYANYYYQNKIACAYVQGAWLPGCEIGSRRGFNGSLAGYKTDAGQWVMDKWKMPKIGYPENNPTNYESIEKKSHFDDNAWMMNYAVTYYTVYDTESYIDIYQNVYNTLN